MFHSNPIENVMNITMSHLKNITDVDTVIGKPIILEDGSVLIPVSKVSVGFLTGGGEFNENTPKKVGKFPFASGSGAGLSITPLGFLHTQNSKSHFISVNEENDKLSDFIVTAINSIKNKKKDEK